MKHVREALAGRAARYPYCAVVHVHGVAELPAHAPRHASKSVSPRGPALLRGIRAAARRRLGRLVSYPELLAMLDEEMARDAAAGTAMTAAAGTLVDALRRQTITAYGIPSDADGDARIGARHEAVPLTALMADNITVNEFDQITVDSAEDMAAWMWGRRNIYHRVRFQTADVLALWPIQAPPPAVTLADLPADWTLMECVAWIMLRDPVVVRDTAPETARPPGTLYAEHRMPDGTKRLVPQTGEAGNSLSRLTATWAAQLVEAPAEAVWHGGDARDALLAELRAGRLRATGSSAGATDKAMTPANWRNALLREQPAGTLIVEPARHGARWWNVTVPRDEVVTIWPLRDAAQERDQMPEASDRTGAPGRPSSKHLVIAEYLRRHEGGEAHSRIADEARALEAWLQAKHPSLAPMTARTIETAIRPEFRIRNPLRTK